MKEDPLFDDDVIEMRPRRRRLWLIGVLVAVAVLFLFGSPLMGLHFYTWAFLGFVAAILAAGVMLMFGGQFAATERPVRAGAFERGAVWLIISLTALNAVSALAECGLASCPANPVRYELLN